MTDKLQEGEWDTEEETLASRGNGQYEPYLVVSKDEADARVAGLEAEIRRLREDQQRLEWLVQQEASVCHVFGMWDVWYSEESRASEHGFGCWREAIDAAMEDSND
jgi:uncharacterized small protein (DUF1192 family)